MYLGEDGPISPRFNMEDDDFMQLGPCGPSGDEDMGEMADYYMNLAMDNDEPYYAPTYSDYAGTYLRDPFHYHTKVYGTVVQSTNKAVLFEWDDRDKPVKVWIPKKLIKGAINASGQDSLWVWTKFWKAKQEEMNWTADVQEEHDRQKATEEAISTFIGDEGSRDPEEADCSHLVTKKKTRSVSCRNSESADCSSMVSERHKRKKARKPAESIPDVDEFGGF